MSEKWRFRRNLVLIALAHLVAVFLIFHFGREGNSGGGGGGDQVTWIDPAAFTKKDSTLDPAPQLEKSTPEPTPITTPEPTTPEPTPQPTTPPLMEDGLNLSTPTPKPTPTPTPKTTATPTPKPKPSVTPNLSPKKTPTPMSKKTPSPTPKRKSTPTADDSEVRPRKSPSPKAVKKPIADDPETTAKKVAALKALHGDSGEAKSPGEKSDSTTGESKSNGKGPGDGSGTGPGKGTGSGGGEGDGTGSGKGAGTDPGLLDAYNQAIKMKCDIWEQPVSQLKVDQKFVTTMTLTISKTGTLESFSVKNSSGNEIVDESVKAFLGTIKRFPAPPTGKEYVININFQLGGE